MDIDKYKRSVAFAQEHNPDLFNDPKKLRAEMLSLEGLANRKQDPVAKYIYVQGRNICATALGVKLMLEPTVVEETATEVPVQPREQIVAVIVRSDIYGRCLKQGIDLFITDQVRYYATTGPLLDDILAGRVIGIVGIPETKNDTSVTESLIRHDLKNLPNWNVQKAEAYPLPPIVEGDFPVNFLKVIMAIHNMHQGNTTEQKETKPFLLAEALGALKRQMHTAQQDITVAVVDDTPKQVTDMVAILEIWPRMTTCVHLGVPKGSAEDLAQKILSSEPYPNIILLDEDLDTCKGTAVANSLIQKGFKGILISTTGGKKPEYTPHHFAAKATVGRVLKTAEHFVGMMNTHIETFS